MQANWGDWAKKSRDGSPVKRKFREVTCADCGCVVLELEAREDGFVKVRDLRPDKTAIDVSRASRADLKAAQLLADEHAKHRLSSS